MKTTLLYRIWKRLLFDKLQAMLYLISLGVYLILCMILYISSGFSQSDVGPLPYHSLSVENSEIQTEQMEVVTRIKVSSSAQSAQSDRQSMAKQFKRYRKKR